MNVMTMLNVSVNTVAARLRAARLLAGLDQAEIAHAVGVGRTTVSSWERGFTEPSVSQFIAWARETKQPVDQLIDGLPGVKCTPWDLNPEPTDSECELELELTFWGIVEPLLILAPVQPDGSMNK